MIERDWGFYLIRSNPTVCCPVHVCKKLVCLKLPILQLLQVIAGQVGIINVNKKQEVPGQLLVYSELHKAFRDGHGQVRGCRFIPETESGHDIFRELTLLVAQSAVDYPVDHGYLHEDPVETHAQGSHMQIPKTFSYV